MRWPGAGPRMELERPLPGAEVSDFVQVAGWAFSRRAPIERIEAALEDGPPIRLTHGQARPDVAAAFGCEAACGFVGVLPLDGAAAGPLTVNVVAVDARGGRATRRVIFRRRHRPAGPLATGPALLESALPPPTTRESAPVPEPPSTVPAATAPNPGGREVGPLLDRLRDELTQDPTLLDATGFGLAAALPGALVVTPLDDATLPYLDASFDVVAIRGPDPDRLALARPLARRAVIGVDAGGSVQVLWSGPPDLARRRPVLSVVIPVFNQSACTDACLGRVLETWPPSVEGEVIVVDDASTDDTAEVLARWSERDARVRALPQPANRGFIVSCNAGAAAARGEVLVFLNNDTLPRAGWLTALVDTLEREGAGAAGGKLLFPDGTLQEAGGVVFADGDGCNFGKGDAEPSHPLFDHVREVDYCSGALLATPRALFQDLGGFDEAYRPAYYEDVDYAFRLRQRGHRVYYQPASTVVHLEGASSGRDLAAGVKRHQVTNRATFRARWEPALADQPPHPPVFDRATWHRLQARRADARRALVVLPTMPEPDREGGSRRAFHIIDLLLAAGWTVSVVVENATGGERYARALQQRGASVYAGEFTRGVGPGHLPRLADLLTVEEFDVALIAFWHVAERHLPTLRRLTPRTRVLVDSVDLHFLRQARGAFGRARLEGRADALDGQFADEVRRELNVYGSADAVLTVSRKEASWVDDLVGVRGHGHCVPLMEDALGPETTLEQRRGLVFLGNFRHPPNVEALAFLAEVVARLDPAVLAAHPLSIVGNALVTGMLGPLAGHPHVRAVGWVPAVEPYLGNARLSLVPLRHGAGTKAKLLQSMVAGTPCVSTSVGVEGFDVADGRDVMVADTAEAFAAAIAALSRDDDAWRRLSRDGRAAVQEAHGRRAVGASLQAALRALL